jgi:hypothetical protein
MLPEFGGVHLVNIRIRALEAADFIMGPGHDIVIDQSGDCLSVLQEGLLDNITA